MKLSIFPYVVQNEIFDNLEISELLLLSFVSKNMKKLIKSSQTSRFKSISQIEYDNSRGYPIRVHIPFVSEFDSPLMEFRERRDYETDDEFFQLKVSGKVLNFQLHYRYSFPQVYFLKDSDRNSAIEAIHYYFLNFFGYTVEYLYRDDYLKIVPHLPKLSLCLKFSTEKVTYWPNQPEAIRDIKKIENFLASSPVLKRIFMDLETPEMFRPESKFYQAESIVLIQNFNTVPAFLRHFQGRQALLYCKTWDILDLIEFMNRWKSGEGSKKMEYLDIRMIANDIHQNEFLNALGVKRIDESKTPPTHTLPKLFNIGFGPNTFPIISRSYVVRETDNRVASVHILGNSFYFGVWNKTEEEFLKMVT
ncbi:hypothetical protein B9Z55_009628 [Caenorhabditis nigoni]|uniref:F-box domain-containing protein n=2 Tax=Caenorhabditis nigoni TaxID=1611254 RepID=A0A2G5USS8_9PELO|nr:hypothetical protein B9Z55_009628 [Caenorhabditis nigoni]